MIGYQQLKNARSLHEPLSQSTKPTPSHMRDKDHRQTRRIRQQHPWAERPISEALPTRLYSVTSRLVSIKRLHKIWQ